MKKKPQRREDDKGDPIVEEIRKIRARFWKKGGGTGEGYLRLMRKLSAYGPQQQNGAASAPKATSAKTRKHRPC